MMSRRQVVKAARNLEPTWRLLFNLAPTLNYRLSRTPISGEAARVTETLNREGVAISSIRALFDSATVFDELSSTVEKMENEQALEIAAARDEANDSSDLGGKSFIYHLLGQNPELDPESVFARFALQDPMLRIANAYFGMYTRLRYYNVWHTFTTRTRARESQLWHRDREDYLILKVFVYLSEVGDGAGPFTYAPGTHLKGRTRSEAAFSLEGNVRRSDDHQMAAVVPPDHWVRCTGPRGTIVFADTRGYHKGGLAREHDRLMYTCMFTSRASQSPEFMRRPAKLASPRRRDLAFALATPGISAAVGPNSAR